MLDQQFILIRVLQVAIMSYYENGFGRFQCEDLELDELNIGLIEE